MRILGVDYGSSRTGVAISDPLGFMAHGIETLCQTSAKKVAEDIKRIAQSYNVGIIVVGLPKNMNNTLGERGNITLRFVNLLKKTVECDVVTWDERLSTVAAANILNETDTRGKKRKDVIDTVAAEIILQSYLDYKRRCGATLKEDFDERGKQQTD